MTRRQREAKHRRRKEWNQAHTGVRLAQMERESNLLNAAIELSAKGFKIPTTGILWTPEGGRDAGKA